MPVTKGATYYIQVGSATDLSSTLNSAVPGFELMRLAIDGSDYAEPNDFFAKATTLTLGTGATVSTDAYLNGSTMESWEPTFITGLADTKRIGSVWYKWTAPQLGTATLDICAFQEPMSIAVFENWESEPGVGAGDLSAAAFGFDNSSCGLGDAATATFTATKGVTYFIQVAKTTPSGYLDGEDRFGTLTLSVVFSGLYIEKISPASGSKYGGTTVTFTGQNFGTDMVVHFGYKSVMIPNPTQTSFTVKTPAHSAAKVSVTITLAGDTSNAKTYTFK